MDRFLRSSRDPAFRDGDQAAMFVPVHTSRFHGAFVLHRRVDLHAIDATPARWRGGAGSSPFDGASTAAHPTHLLISAQVSTEGPE